jgi:hypothetical protein
MADMTEPKPSKPLQRVVKGQVWEDTDRRRTITVLETPNTDVEDPGAVKVEVMGLVRSRIALRRFGTSAYRLQRDVT